MIATDEIEGNYWLHVQRDGREIKFPTRPEGISSVFVEVKSTHEETTTQNRLEPHPVYKHLMYKPVPPPGYGWVKHRRQIGQHPSITRWRRL